MLKLTPENVFRVFGASLSIASQISLLDPTKIRDLSPDVLGVDGRMQVLPAAYWAMTTTEERALFGNRRGLYLFPTLELVARLQEIIGGRTAIEIGAGNGVLAEALGIVATDSCEQRKSPIRELYALNRWTRVPYGPNVVEMHASRAVRTYKPQVVLGCWVTHKMDLKQEHRGGKPNGIDEPDILRHCEHYVLVGNESVHAQKCIWDRPHTIEYPDYVYSRATNGTREFIAVFKGLR